MRETQVVYNWHQFLKAASEVNLTQYVVSCSDWDPANSIPELKVLDLGDILQFGSGSRFPNFKGIMLFNHLQEECTNERLRANTCSFTITIPMNKRYCCKAKEFAQHILEDIFSDLLILKIVTIC